MFPAIELISMDGCYVLLEGGTILPVTNWFDDNGDECEPDDAVSCVAGRDGYGWLSIDLGEFTGNEVH